MNTGGTQSGFTVIEALIGIAIVSIVSTSIYFAYSNVLEIIQTAQYNNAALSIMESRIETARNMRYEDVGVIGGVPAGKLQQTEIVTLGLTPYTLHTYVRNIDDAFDGILGGSPNDTAPADYKLIEFQVTCATCPRYHVLRMATYVAPKNLESASKNGNLFVRVLDASGIPVSGATVHVTNSSVIPPIDLTDVTNSTGFLQLVDVATSSSKYHIVVSKAGYTSDQTYPPGNPANPLKPDATVATQQVTTTSLFIDRVSTVTIRARDQFCAPSSGFDFLLTGGKLIATQPNVPKFSGTFATATNGSFVNSALEWDTYAFHPIDTTNDIAGGIASLSLTVNPNTTQSLTWMVASRSQSGLSISVHDQNGVPLNDALVQVTQTGYDRTAITGRSTLQQTDWSLGQFSEKSAFLETATLGELTLMLSNGSYASAGQEWLISESYNLGTSSTNFTTLNWTPTSQAPLVGTDSVQLQLAGNTDNSTWNWVGPDGTPSSFFTTSGATIPSSLNGSQYLRYRVFLRTADDSATPTVQNVSIGFSSGCIPTGHAYINGLSVGTATVTVTHAGYQTNSTPFDITDSWHHTSIQLAP